MLTPLFLSLHCSDLPPLIKIAKCIIASIIKDWSVDSFEMSQKVGEGAFGSVYLAREKQSGYIVAVKKFEISDVNVVQLQKGITKQQRLR